MWPYHRAPLAAIEISIAAIAPQLDLPILVHPSRTNSQPHIGYAANARHSSFDWATRDEFQLDTILCWWEITIGIAVFREERELTIGRLLDLPFFGTAPHDSCRMGATPNRSPGSAHNLAKLFFLIQTGHGRRLSDKKRTMFAKNGQDRAWQMQQGSLRMSKVAWRSVFILLALSVVLTAAPVSGGICIAGKPNVRSCSCCPGNICCAEGGKKDPSSAQLLTPKNAGRELNYNISSSFATIERVFPRKNPAPERASDWLGYSPPKRALLCTFLI